MNDYDFHPEALVDLKAIWDFIVQDNRNAADKVNEAILDAVAALVPLPHQGHQRPDLTKRPLRFVTVYDYLIAYAPDDSPLWVVAILHGKRSPRLLASILSNRESV